MKMQPKPVRGSVRILLCDTCRAEFPTFDFEVESDADAIGLYSAGTCDGKRLLLIDLSLEEWKAAQDGSLSKPPSRLSFEVDKEYRLTYVSRVLQPVLPSGGGSFEEFRRQYEAPTVVYWCPCCGDGGATTKTEVTPEDYLKSGGQIETLEPLTLVI